jgi:hypothetical protein
MAEHCSSNLSGTAPMAACGAIGWQRHVPGLALLAVLAFGAFAAQSQAPLRARVGAWYFEGWTGETTIHITDRLKTEFGDREPVWGWTNSSVDVIARQIDYAADHGLQFWAFDWYYPEGPDKRTPVNRGLEFYLQATNRARLDFCLLAVNHAGFVFGPDDWDTLCDIWIRHMKDPQYVTVDGKPLLIIFSHADMERTFGGTNAVRGAFDTLRDRARTAGLPGVTVATCAKPGPEKGWRDVRALEASGYDAFTGYNYNGYMPSHPRQKEQEFDSLIRGHEDIWNRFARKNTRPYIPVVTTGWDKRPWEDAAQPPQGVFYTGRSPEKVAAFVDKAVAWLDAHPAHTTHERLVILYAWNENGEGGYLTPTKSDGDRYLKAIHRVLRPTR